MIARRRALQRFAALAIGMSMARGQVPRQCLRHGREIRWRMRWRRPAAKDNETVRRGVNVPGAKRGVLHDGRSALADAPVSGRRGANEIVLHRARGKGFVIHPGAGDASLPRLTRGARPRPLRAVGQAETLLYCAARLRREREENGCDGESFAHNRGTQSRRKRSPPRARTTTFKLICFRFAKARRTPSPLAPRSPAP